MPDGFDDECTLCRYSRYRITGLSHTVEQTLFPAPGHVGTYIQNPHRFTDPRGHVASPQTSPRSLHTHRTPIGSRSGPTATHCTSIHQPAGRTSKMFRVAVWCVRRLTVTFRSIKSILRGEIQLTRRAVFPFSAEATRRDGHFQEMSCSGEETSSCEELCRTAPRPRRASVRDRTRGYASWPTRAAALV